MRGIGKFRVPGIAGALLLAVTGGVLLAGSGTSARADTVFSLPASVTYLNQTLPDTLGGNDYVFIAANGEIFLYDLAGQQITTFDANDGIGALALSPDGGTLYASVGPGAGANADSIAAITVSSIANGPLKQTFYPLAAGDQPGSIAVQSGKVWVAYSSTAGAVTTTQIGAMDLPGAGTFEPAAAPGTWDKPVNLAGSSQDKGVLVAVSYDSPAEAATYDTTTDPATAISAQGALGTGGNACSYLGELAVVQNGTAFAAGCDGPASVQVYSTADMADAGAYNANGGGTSQAIAVAVDADSTFAVANRTSVYVYKPNGTLLNTFAITAGNKTDEAYGLAWADTAGGSSLVAVSQVASDPANPSLVRPYTVQIFSKAKLLRPTVKFSATAKTAFGKPITLTGTSLLQGGAADTAPVTIERTGPGGTMSFRTVTPSSAGVFTATDTPTAVGGYTYTATSGATSVAAKVTVVKDTPALKLTPVNSTVGYKSVVHLTATLGATHGNRSVTIYAPVKGGKSKVIASGKVNGKGQLSVAWTAIQSSTFLVKFAGDTDDHPVSATATASVRAQVTGTLSGQYGTKKSGGITYRLYHRAGKVTVAATVTPSHQGECVKAELQEFVNGAWHASTTTGCAKLSAASKAALSLALGKAQLGVPYRVRAGYVSGSKTNASGDSAWQYLMVEK